MSFLLKVVRSFRTSHFRTNLRENQSNGLDPVPLFKTFSFATISVCVSSSVTRMYHSFYWCGCRDVVSRRRLNLSVFGTVSFRESSIFLSKFTQRHFSFIECNAVPEIRSNLLITDTTSITCTKRSWKCLFLKRSKRLYTSCFFRQRKKSMLLVGRTQLIYHWYIS